MNPVIRNILAVIGGIIIGGIVNMALIKGLHILIPAPEGVNPEDIESIKENIHRFEFKHFLSPFLAHAMGTFVGALVAASIGISHRLRLAIIVGIFFLIGGIMMVIMLPIAPAWFKIVDIAFAYIPCALLGGFIGQNLLKR